MRGTTARGRRDGGWSPTRKLLASVAVLGAAASIAGLGTFATFTSSTSASHAVSSGTVTIALGATGAATNRLTVGASAIAPGDTIQRSVDLIDSGSIDLASITLTTTATSSSLLDTDTTNGLQMVIDKCSNAWTESGPPYTYTCSGATSSVLASRAVIGNTLALSNLGSLDRRHDRPPARDADAAQRRGQLAAEPVVHDQLRLHGHPAHRGQQVGLVRDRSARKSRSPADVLARLFLAFALLALVLLGLLPNLGWYRTETVLSGSMKPYFGPGDIVVVTPEATRDVRVGQVISYHIPVGDHHVQSHRVIEVVRGGDHPLVRTKGDANASPDPWTARLNGGTAWQVRAVVPKVGWAIVWLRTPAIRRVAIFALPLLLAILGLLRIWRVPGNDQQDEAPDAPTRPAPLV